MDISQDRFHHKNFTSKNGIDEDKKQRHKFQNGRCLKIPPQERFTPVKLYSLLIKTNHYFQPKLNVEEKRKCKKVPIQSSAKIK